MKGILLIAVVGIVFVGCSKKQTPIQKPMVSINGTAYPTVVIGFQTWTAVNYNGPGGVNYGLGSNTPIYGKLYNYYEAAAIPLPPGWRLPTKQDYNMLLSSIGAPDNNGVYMATGSICWSLMATNSWNVPGVTPTNASGFNATAAGLGGGGKFIGMGSSAQFQTADTVVIQQKTYNMCFNIDAGPSLTEATVAIEVSPLSYDLASVRFVKDN